MSFLRREFHPVADIFPMMADRELAELVEDIRAHGLREPIWLHRDGQVIDGRNRYLACQRLGAEPAVRTFAGEDSDLVEFVVSLNLHRRHLNEAQRAIVASRIATLPRGVNQHASIEAPSQERAADLMNVGRASVQRAKKVLDAGTPELVARVDSGDIPVSTAADIAETVQQQAAGLDPDEVHAIIDAAVADRRRQRGEVREQNGQMRRDAEAIPAETMAGIDDLDRRLKAVNRIADGCELLLREVDGIDPTVAVRDAHPTNRERLAVVRDALDYLTRVVDAMQPTGVTA